MNKLQVLVNEHNDLMCRQKADMDKSTACAQRTRLDKAQQRLITARLDWGLDELVGLRGDNYQLDEHGRLYHPGEMCVEGVRMDTRVVTQVEDWGNIAVMLATADGFEATETFNPTLDEATFMAALLTSVLQFLTKRASALDLRDRRLPTARKLVALAKQYQDREALYVEMQRQWAEQWTRELGQPWGLWRVRYLPVYYHALTDVVAQAGGPEVVMCLEGPDVILEALRHFSSATIQRVHTDGQIFTMEIASFLDAEYVPQEMVSIGKHLPYHRAYAGEKVVVNVPAIESREPDKAPTLAVFSEWLAGVDETLVAVAKRCAEADFSVADIAEIDPDVLVAGWGRLVD